METLAAFQPAPSGGGEFDRLRTAYSFPIVSHNNDFTHMQETQSSLLPHIFSTWMVFTVELLIVKDQTAGGTVPWIIVHVTTSETHIIIIEVNV